MNMLHNGEKGRSEASGPYTEHGTSAQAGPQVAELMRYTPASMALSGDGPLSGSEPLAGDNLDLGLRTPVRPGRSCHRIVVVGGDGAVSPSAKIPPVGIAPLDFRESTYAAGREHDHGCWRALRRRGR